MGGLPLNDPKFWVAVSFFVFLAVAWKPLILRILRLLDARAERIRSEIAEAERLRAEAEALLRDAKARHEAAKAEAEAMLAHAREEAERVAKELAEATAAAMARRERMALDRIAAAEAEAAASIRAKAAELAVAATKRLIADHLTPDRHAALIGRAIDDLPQKLH
ncbi:MAG: F0F1 ATP synthase subunit B [Acetobacteraceae bacterium]|nr:F0F1 ATP synthase subunit B [Acetobacteraceae bacterium]